MSVDQTKVTKAITNYVSLRNAWNDSNYGSTFHTYSALLKAEAVLKQMYKKDSFKAIIDANLPTKYKDILA
jgi:hypothetical protein